ncbi:MAG: chromosome partitioning protein ParB, partial [Deltaproteobacteria bacterium]|nr:chromosome partitioning protein ParB [Deltaproteobacteria bacterium]
MVELELGQLDCKYAGLRVAAPASALLASLSEFGQQTPVLVVGGADNGTGAVLVDGYRRKAALHT